MAGALYKLCRDNRYTCWTGGRDDSTDLCPLMTQEGYIVQQACEQPVRFVCRTTGESACCLIAAPVRLSSRGTHGHMKTPGHATSASIILLRLA